MPTTTDSLSPFSNLCSKEARISAIHAVHPALTLPASLSGITYMPCGPENDFFPDITLAKDSDVIM